MKHAQSRTSTSNLLVAITCPTHVSHKKLHLKKPSAELGVQNSPIIKNSSVLPFQVESSNPLFGCSELDLQSLSMIPCSIGWTIPKRGRWEESPSQQASISCQHSSSNTGRRSGRTPAKGRGTQLPSTSTENCLMMFISLVQVEKLLFTIWKQNEYSPQLKKINEIVLLGASSSWEQAMSAVYVAFWPNTRFTHLS